jgi:hypothetical protein
MTTTAVQNALSLPEILTVIFESAYTDERTQWFTKPAALFLVYGKPAYVRRDGMLVRFGLVNKTWFYEAIRVLWRDVSGLDSFVLHRTFYSLELVRRQGYANYICTAGFNTCLLGEVNTAGKALGSVVFPQLTKLHLHAPNVKQFESRVYATLQAPALRTLIVHECPNGPPQFRLPVKEIMDIFYSLIPVSMKCELCRFYFTNWRKQRFPTVQEIRFDQPSISHELISKEKWAQFIQDLPKLQTLNGVTVRRAIPSETLRVAPWATWDDVNT